VTRMLNLPRLPRHRGRSPVGATPQQVLVTASVGVFL
jgi:hypothetical protein